MGGDREATLQSSPAQEVAPEMIGSVGGSAGVRLRIHQNAGEVHFHDDQNQIKCAVPVAEWWKAWERLRSQPGAWNWIDTVNNSVLALSTELTTSGPNQATVEAKLNVFKLGAVGSNFSELQKFTKRK